MKRTMLVFAVLYLFIGNNNDLHAQNAGNDLMIDSIHQNNDAIAIASNSYGAVFSLYKEMYPVSKPTIMTFNVTPVSTMAAVTKYRLKNLWKEYRWPIILLAAAGMVDAGNQAAQFNYETFSGRFAFLHFNKDWWDPGISWRNKYKNQDPAQGAKFFLSKSSLVMFTDWYHMSRTIEQLLVISAVSVSVPSIPITYSAPAKYYSPKDSVMHDARLIKIGKTRIGQVGKKWYVYLGQVIGGWLINRVVFQVAYDYMTH